MEVFARKAFGSSMLVSPNREDSIIFIIIIIIITTSIVIMLCDLCAYIEKNERNAFVVGQSMIPYVFGPESQSNPISSRSFSRLGSRTPRDWRWR